MKNIVTLAVAAVVVLTFRNAPAAESARDSLAYLDIRAQVLQSDPSNQALLSAHALFDAGLFTEAVELLREHAPPPGAAKQPARPEGSPHVQWRVSTGIDYYHLEDFDTITMTPEELRDYKRLTETPLSLWLRAKVSIRPQTGHVENVDPEAYLSERKGRLETTARFSSPGGAFRFEPSIKTEKWFRPDASDDTTFAPAKPQPSDMGGAAFRMTLENQRQEEALFRFNAPVSVDWEDYRSDRPGYESFVEYRLLPSLEIPRGKLPLHLRFSGQAEFEDYYREESDRLDVVRLSGRVEGNARGDKRNGNISVAWMGDRYTSDSDPAAIDRLEGAFRGECSIAGPLSARVRMRGIHEMENGSDEDEEDYHAAGSELTACPGLETALFGNRLHAGPELLWERRWGGASVARSVWYGRTAVEPGLHAGWSDGIIDASVRAAYRSERFDGRFKTLPTTEDNRSFRGGAEISASPVPFLLLDLFADYQYRVYAPYGNRARVSENITVSGSVTARW
jgi:hypothetical protein